MRKIMGIPTRAGRRAVLPEQQQGPLTQRDVLMQGTCVHRPTKTVDLLEIKASQIWDRMMQMDEIPQHMSRGRFIEYALNTQHILDGCHPYGCTSTTIACIVNDVRGTVSKNGFVLLAEDATICKSKSCYKRERCTCGIKRSHQCMKRDAYATRRRKSC